MKCVGLLCCVAAAVQCHPAPSASVKPLPVARGAIKVVTFNVNYAGVDMERSARALLATQADVIALQETTPRWERFLRRRLGARYPYLGFRHAGGAGGQAFLSRYPWVAQRVGAPPRGGWFPAWRVTIRVRGRLVHLLNVHLRPPVGAAGTTSSVASAYFRTRAVRRRELQRHVRLIPPHGPVIVLGDFNESDGGRAVAWLKSQGFTSALATHDRRTATWQWRTSFGTVRARLDHLLVRGLRCTGAQVLPDAASDHFPVEAVFALR